MKSYIKTGLLAGILSLTVSSVAFADGNINKYGVDTEICDLALIYAGNSKRLSWTEAHFEPYLTHKYADGTESWLFDGFLFLEFVNGDVGYGNGMGSTWAKQENYNWQLDQYFDPQLKLHALDRLITAKKVKLGEPPLRHKVVIAAIAPRKGASGVWPRLPIWGSIDGISMKLIVKEDRIKITEWYIDQIIERWNKADFKNLDLAGIYWVEEGLTSNGEIMAEINDYIRSKGLRSYWIPYYGEGNDRYWKVWKENYKFDMVYVQPNYAFYKSDNSLRPYSALTDACNAAYSYGMGLELEFETQEKSTAMHSQNPTLHQRINDYMDVFNNKGVFADAGVAYYTGTKGLYDMATIGDATDHQTMDRLARFVVARQKARQQATGIDDVRVDEKWVESTDGGIVIYESAPDARCYDLSGRLILSGPGSVSCRPGIYIASDGRGNTVKLHVK